MTEFQVIFVGAGAVNFGTPTAPWNHSLRLERYPLTLALVTSGYSALASVSLPLSIQIFVVPNMFLPRKLVRPLVILIPQQ